MYIEQMYTNCLAEAAYYIESHGEAVIIDPLRDVDVYIEKAKERGAKIKYILETHFHADFVSGHIELANKTDAGIVYGPTAKPAFDAHIAVDNEVFQIGDLKIKVLHTPGHTIESTTYLLYGTNGKPYAIFTGDTLFIGDVGRPDLAVKSDLSQEDLAGLLYDSIHSRIMTLPDETIVYPGHGAGSSCGKNLSEETFDTLGRQKISNYALQDITKSKFIELVTDGLKAPPQYFPKNVYLNKMGYESLDRVMERGLKALNLSGFDNELEQGALILDVRDKDEIRKGYIKNSINIGLDGMYAIWVGTLIDDLQCPIVIISDPERVEEAIVRLARVGYDNVKGYLDGGFKTWADNKRDVEKMDSIKAEPFAEMPNNTSHALDVRKEGEYESQHIDGTRLFPLDFINENLDLLNKSEHYYVHCKTGYRSMIASSVLKREGFENITDIEGGIDSILGTSLPTAGSSCETNFFSDN